MAPLLNAAHTACDICQPCAVPAGHLASEFHDLRQCLHLTSSDQSSSLSLAMVSLAKLKTHKSSKKQKCNINSEWFITV